MSPRRAIGFLVFLIACVPLALAQGTYTQIDYPGGTGTIPWGINTAGDISGRYLDVSGNSHGFLFSHGTYTPIDDPSGQSTLLLGLNDMGQIVGVSNVRGFIYDLHTQTFTEVNYPGSEGTTPIGINNAGTIVGYYLNVVGHQSKFQGFELEGSTYSTIAWNMHETMAWGINRSGTVVGDSFFVNFRFQKGNYRRIFLPKGTLFIVNGINNTGAVAGYYPPSAPIDGFVFSNHTVTTLIFPGANDTAATGINDAGEVVGYFLDVNFGYHGFTWTPPADAAKK